VTNNPKVKDLPEIPPSLIIPAAQGAKVEIGLTQPPILNLQFQ
jgi:hypothetical protein